MKSSAMRTLFSATVVLGAACGVLGGVVIASAAEELPTSGKEAYERGCASCHAAGANGAPAVGDHAAWGMRIAQGRMTLYRHTIAGKGGMPARGGTQWPDATIRLAVDYMVSLNK